MKQKDIILLAVPLCILILVWVGVNVYHSSVRSTISEKLTTQIIPIAPTFNTQTIDALKKRQRVSGQFTLVSTPTPPITAIPSPSVIPVKPSPSPTVINASASAVTQFSTGSASTP